MNFDFLITTPITILALALILAFEIWMFIDAYKNTHLSSNAKVLWLVGMGLLHPIIAVVYYLTARKAQNE